VEDLVVVVGVVLEALVDLEDRVDHRRVSTRMLPRRRRKG
jgi:hypothetical protein